MRSHQWIIIENLLILFINFFFLNQSSCLSHWLIRGLLIGLIKKVLHGPVKHNIIRDSFLHLLFLLDAALKCNIKGFGELVARETAQWEGFVLYMKHHEHEQHGSNALVHEHGQPVLLVSRRADVLGLIVDLSLGWIIHNYCIVSVDNYLLLHGRTHEVYSEVRRQVCLIQNSQF